MPCVPSPPRVTGLSPDSAHGGHSQPGVDVDELLLEEDELLLDEDELLLDDELLELPEVELLLELLDEELMDLLGKMDRSVPDGGGAPGAPAERTTRPNHAYHPL